MGIKTMSVAAAVLLSAVCVMTALTAEGNPDASDQDRLVSLEESRLSDPSKSTTHRYSNR